MIMSQVSTHVQVTEGKPYLTGSGPGAWLDPPALLPSQSSAEISSWCSSTLPGRSQGSGGRSKGVPVLISRRIYNGTLTTKRLQLDCRGTQVPDLGKKTTGAVVELCAEQSEGRIGTTFVPSQGFDVFKLI